MFNSMVMHPIVLGHKVGWSRSVNKEKQWDVPGLGRSPILRLFPPFGREGSLNILSISILTFDGFLSFLECSGLQEAKNELIE